jgi:hypothetical protein
MNRDIKEIIKDIKETEQTSLITSEEIPYKARGGMASKIRLACERLPELLKEIELALIPSKLIALYSSGDLGVISNVSTFIKETKGIVLNSNEMYQKVADRVEQTYSPNRTFTTTQHSVMLQQIREIALMFDYLELPAPKYQEAICPDSKCTLAHIKKCIRSSIGDDLNIRFLKKYLVESVLKTKNPPKTIPILVLNVSSEEEKSVLNQLFNQTNSFNFKPDFEIDQKTIVKLFKFQPKVDNNVANE